MQHAAVKASGHLWWPLLLALVLLTAGSAWALSPLDGGWRPARAGDTPAQVLQEFTAGQLTSFDPSAPTQFATGDRGAWVVLAPRPPWDNSERVLAIYPPPWSMVTPYPASLQSAPPLALTNPQPAMPGHGRLAWRLPLDQPGSMPILLRIEPSAASNAPMRFALAPLAEYLQRDAGWLVFASACFSVMLAMVLMALCFALMLRDVAYAWYAGYILCYAMIQATETGFVFHPLGWQWLASGAATAHSAAVALSVAFAALFMARFCQLQRYLPLLRIPVLGLAVGMIQLVLLRASQLPLLLDVEKVLFTPMLTLGALLLLFTSIAAAVRGSRPAWYFLAGWVPLVLLTAASNMQFSGGLVGWTWLNDASLAVGAFEAIMLSIGLSDRALTLRQDRDEVRVLADHDALTDVYNRRAWSERASALLAATPARPLALLFLDLDHFKALNDRLGHHSGDRALIAVAKALATELRPQDLLGRYGGEEFVVLLDATHAAQALDVATRLCRRVHRLEIPANGESSMLTVSIGIAMHREGDTLESLIERADQAMYSAKLNGRNQVCVHQLATSRERSMHLVDRRSRDS